MELQHPYADRTDSTSPVIDLDPALAKYARNVCDTLFSDAVLQELIHAPQYAIVRQGDICITGRVTMLGIRDTKMLSFMSIRLGSLIETSLV